MKDLLIYKRVSIVISIFLSLIFINKFIINFNLYKKNKQKKNKNNIEPFKKDKYKINNKIKKQIIDNNNLNKNNNLVSNKSREIRKRGDINGDGKINASDVTYLLSYLAGDPNYPLTGEGLLAADCNNDGKINASDATYLLSYLAGDPNYQLEPLPQPEPEPINNNFNLIFNNNNIGGIDYIWNDSMKNTIIEASNIWNNVITNLPGELYKTSNKIDINIYFDDLDTGVLAAAGPSLLSRNSSGIYYSVEGVIYFSTDYFYLWNLSEIDINSLLYRVFLHETGHIFGIGTLWNSSYNNLLTNVVDTDSGKVNIIYNGTNANFVYKYYNSASNNLFINLVDTSYKNINYPNVDDCLGIPVEDDGGGGTAGGHPEEGDVESISTNNRTINGILYPGLGDELMTGWDESPGTNMPLSAITFGFLEDLGYSVNYSNAETYILGTGADI